MARAPSLAPTSPMSRSPASPIRRPDSPSEARSAASQAPGWCLRNNGGDDLSICTNGPFTFATALTRGSSYAVTVAPSPPDRPAPSRMARALSVAPTSPPSASPVSPIRRPDSPSEARSAASQAPASSCGTTAATTSPSPPTAPSPSPPPYRRQQLSVTVSPSPSGQTCTVSNGSGTVGSTNVTTVAVACATNPPPSSPSEAPSAGLSGAGLVLRNNGGDDLAVSTNGLFTFATSLLSGSSYRSRSRPSPPADLHRLEWLGHRRWHQRDDCRGRLRHQSPAEIHHRRHGGGPVGRRAGPAEQRRRRPRRQRERPLHLRHLPDSRQQLSVTVAPSPSGQTCTVSSGSGTVGNANVTNVAVACVTNPPPRFTIGGTVTGLAASGLVLRNNGGDDLSVSASGPFTFATALTSGSTYSVTVSRQPSGQTCTVSAGTGTVGNANVTSVLVSCSPAPPSQPTLVQHVSSGTNILGRGLRRTTSVSPFRIRSAQGMSSSWGSPTGLLPARPPR